MIDPYRIRPCRLADLRALALAMRENDRAELVGLGMEPRHALFQLWRETADPRMAEYCDDGIWRVAAAWGDCGTMLDPVGTAWLFTTEMVEKAPLAFYRHTKAWVCNRLTVRRRLVSSIRSDYAGALRFFKMIGFDIAEPCPQPPYGIAYSVIEMSR